MERIRLFKSPWLEELTLTTPGSVAALWSCAIAGLVVAAWSSPTWTLVAAMPWFLGGLCAWTLFEYGMHRIVFHWQASSTYGRNMVFVIHGGHHLQPEDPMRGLMPPIASVPIALALFGASALVLERPWLESAFAGFIVGYLAFDLLHWACHHVRPRTAIGRALRRYHFNHHFDRRAGNFGVSTPVWDFVFGTRLAKEN